VENPPRSQTVSSSVDSERGTPAGAPRGLGRETLERVRRRDPEALGEFFDTYFDRVFGFVRRLVGDPTVAEDVAQEVFLKVHRAADRLDAGRDPVPWLMAIAHNACRDLWRSGAYRMARRATPVEETPGLERALTAGSNPERELLAAERERLVQAAVMKLPESLRAPVLMHDYEGLGHEEIAVALGIGYAAARKRYSRALAALGKLLRETMA
jgi:RNA polymerase sigma-70 factor (ECF subfamily)